MLDTKKLMAGWNFRHHSASNSILLPYQIYLPRSYNTSKKYPVFLYMHGMGSVGCDGNHINQSVARILNNITSSDKYKDDVIIIAPQSPKGQKWVEVDYTKGIYSFDELVMTSYLEAAKELFDCAINSLPIDTDRIYGYGNSMGAFATVCLAMKFPEFYTAIVPVAGGYDPEKAELIRDLPIWIFHGDSDRTVPIIAAERLVHNLRLIGSHNVNYTVFEGVGHHAQHCFVAAADTHGLLDWIFSKQK